MIISRDVMLIAAVFYVRYRTLPTPVSLFKKKKMFFSSICNLRQKKKTLLCTDFHFMGIIYDNHVFNPFTRNLKKTDYHLAFESPL